MKIYHAYFIMAIWFLFLAVWGIHSGEQFVFFLLGFFEATAFLYGAIGWFYASTGRLPEAITGKP